MRRATMVLLASGLLAAGGLGCDMDSNGADEDRPHSELDGDATRELRAEPRPAPAPEAAPQAGAAGEQMVAVARLSPTEGSQVSGQIRFQPTGGGEVRVEGRVTGLTGGPHGFHVHENGDCDCPDGQCAGGHFNPTGAPHGGPEDEARHVGDLGNIEAGEDGVAEVSLVDPVITLEGDHSIVGRSVIVHAGRDDLESQPSGDAGARLACGVIERGPAQAGATGTPAATDGPGRQG